MSVLGLNTNALIYPTTGRSQTGEWVYGTPVPAKIAVIKMNDIVQISPIRSEASASHGRVEEDVGPIIALFHSSAVIKNGFRVDALVTSMEITGIFPREDGFGRLSHYEVALKALLLNTGAVYVPSTPSI